MDFINLLNRRPLDRSLGEFDSEGPILLRVEEFLAVGNLEFPILLYESKDIDRSAGGERDAVDSRACPCCLRRDYMSSSEAI